LFFQRSLSAPFLLLLVVLGGTVLLYQQALEFPLQFDDVPNLEGLGKVEDTDSALMFIAKGEAGPLGRPLALASFLLEGTGWPGSVPEMRRINVLIHLINGLLVYYLGYLLCLYGLHQDERKAGWTALFVAALWVVNPLLISTSLMLIQRMTSLSALFVLAGLVTYLKGRIAFSSNPRSGLAWMSAGVVLGTLLAVLTKENGALLPLYALAMEALLPHPSGKTEWKRRFFWWRRLFLWLPVMAILLYLTIRWPDFQRSYQFRPFTLSERLLTESRILWDYLFQALVPRSTGLGPFHDDFPLSGGLFDPPITALSLGAWLAVVLLSLLFRRRYPIVLFAVAWYLGGHLLESTVVPLELYFPHRNYLPLVGPIFLLAQLPFLASGKYKKVMVAGGIALILVQGMVTWQTINLWGRPLLAAEIWYRQHPTSVRAPQYLSQRYLEKGWVRDAYEILVEAKKRLPRSTSLAMQTFKLSCFLTGDKRKLEKEFEEVLHTARKGGHEFAIVRALEKMLSMREARECHGVLADERLDALVEALLSNPAIVANDSTHANLLVLKSKINIKKKNLNGTVRSLEESFEVLPTPVTAVMLAAILASAGHHEIALRKLDLAREKMPLNPLKRWYWAKLLNGYERQLEELHDEVGRGNAE